MFLIAGLGNPDPEYEKTRHNVGFEVIDRLADRFAIPMNQKKFRAVIGKGMIDGQKVILAKPQTYMNLSGESIRAIIDYYDLDPAMDLIVVCDDVNLDTGRIRIRLKGSAGGHNGLKNIIQHLNNSTEFVRVRVGVGAKPENGDLVKHVLGRFGGDEKKIMDYAEDRAAEACEAILTEQIDRVMEEYNRVVSPEKES